MEKKDLKFIYKLCHIFTKNRKNIQLLQEHHHKEKPKKKLATTVSKTNQGI